LADLAPQGSAAQALGIETLADDSTLANAILDDVPLKKTVKSSYLNGLDIIIGGQELSTLEFRVKNPLTATRDLSRLLKPLKGKYDFCILDAPPSLSLMFTNALSASDDFIVPLTPSFLSAKGLDGLLTTIEEAKKGLNINPNLLGILLTMFDKRLALDKEVESNLRRVFGKKVFSQTVRLTVRIKESPGHFQSIYDHAPNSAGASDYSLFTKELLRRMGYPARKKKR